LIWTNSWELLTMIFKAYASLNWGLPHDAAHLCGLAVTSSMVTYGYTVSDLRFPRRWLWRMSSSGTSRRVILVRIDVSEELGVSLQAMPWRIRGSVCTDLSTFTSAQVSGEWLLPLSDPSHTRKGSTIPAGKGIGWASEPSVFWMGLERRSIGYVADRSLMYRPSSSGIRRPDWEA
jgi:hypothetical protein